MCVLTGEEIKNRARDIFTNESYSSACAQEASYDLRVDTGPYLRIGGKLYEEAIPYKKPSIEIKPGELALLPTVESFCMPADLVGDIKIKFKYSRQGLTPLFGPKVDPYFGNGHTNERLYLWVSNLGLRDIVITRYDPVFTVQFHKLYGLSPMPEQKKPIGPTVAKEIRQMGHGQYLGFTDAIEAKIKEEFASRLNRVEHGTQQVVMFGVFLVTSALLATALGAIFAMVSAFNTETGIATLNALTGSLWGLLIFASCAGLAFLVFVVTVAAAVKLAFSVVDSIKNPVTRIGSRF